MSDAAATWRKLALLAALLSVGAYAQEEDLTLPPRIDDEAPREARLAVPPAEDRQPAMEEVLVVRENPWRLPDLGSEWRARQEENASTGRIEGDLLPLFDPEEERPFQDLFLVNQELRRAGFIQVFRVRFGNR